MVCPRFLATAATIMVFAAIGDSSAALGPHNIEDMTEEEVENSTQKRWNPNSRFLGVNSIDIHFCPKVCPKTCPRCQIEKDICSDMHENMWARLRDLHPGMWAIHAT